MHQYLMKTRSSTILKTELVNWYVTKLRHTLKHNPIGTIVVGLWMKYDNLSIVPIPGMIPTTTHIQIKSMLHFEVFQILHKSLIRYHFFDSTMHNFPSFSHKALYMVLLFLILEPIGRASKIPHPFVKSSASVHIPNQSLNTLDNTHWDPLSSQVSLQNYLLLWQV